MFSRLQHIFAHLIHTHSPVRVVCFYFGNKYYVYFIVMNLLRMHFRRWLHFSFWFCYYFQLNVISFTLLNWNFQFEISKTDANNLKSAKLMPIKFSLHEFRIYELHSNYRYKWLLNAQKICILNISALFFFKFKVFFIKICLWLSYKCYILHWTPTFFFWHSSIFEPLKWKAFSKMRWICDLLVCAIQTAFNNIYWMSKFSKRKVKYLSIFYFNHLDNTRSAHAGAC